MKPGLAILPMDVWADVFVYPWISRQQLAQIVHKLKERQFAEKLQTFLHDPKCGKHCLRILEISSNKLINKIADNVGDHGFINKLQTFLLDCGKQTLQYFGISSKQDEPTQEPNNQFLSAITSSAFIIYLEFLGQIEQHNRADEFKVENGATNEELAVHNAVFKDNDGYALHYVEILRFPCGAVDKMREWIGKRAYFERKFGSHDEPNKAIHIWDPTIGHITEIADSMDQDNDQQADNDKDEAGPSTAAEKMRK